MVQATAVVLDKDKSERDDIRVRLSHCGVMPICFQDEWICLENIYHIKPRFAVLGTGSTAFASRFVNVAKAIKNNFPVVVLSNPGEIENQIQNNWLENIVYLRYPADDQEFRGAINRLADSEPPAHGASMVAGSNARRMLVKILPKLAVSREPILIQGEPGVGKKRMAREIHRRSLDETAGFETIDGKSLSGHWIRQTSQRFEVSATRKRSFKTIVIENIDQMPFGLQSQMLLLLENASSVMNNANKTFARIIALTKRDLALSVNQGTFRKDLYHRLSVLKIDIPPLREHVSDIRAMAEYFAIQYSVHLKGMVCRLPDAMIDAFLEYHWPGNVAELKRGIRQLVTAKNYPWTCDRSTACKYGSDENDVCPPIWGIDAADVRRFLNGNRDVSLKQARSRYVVQVEKKMLKAALEKTGGNCKKAAGLLDISYKSMLNKAKAYQLV